MLERKMRTMSIVVVAGLVLALAPLAHAEMITNGGFELPASGAGGGNGVDPTGWTTDFNSYGQLTGFGPHTGVYALHTGSSYESGGRYQDLATLVGITYDVSLWIKDFSGAEKSGALLGVVIANTGSNAIDIGGSGATDTGALYDSANLIVNANHTATASWSEVTFQFTALATTTRFGIYLDDADVSGGTLKEYALDIDDVSVTPEPATMTMLALGGLSVLARRRRRS